MVDPDSDKVSRASPYSGTVRQSNHHFAYGDFTLFVLLSQNSSAIVTVSHSVPCGQTALQPQSNDWFRLFRFRSPLLSESRWFLFPGYWDGSVPLVSLPHPILFRCRITASRLLGYPIRLSWDQGMCASPPGFSQLTTAFFASIRQGIHRKPYSRLTILLFVLIFRLDFCPFPMYFKDHVKNLAGFLLLLNWNWR